MHINEAKEIVKHYVDTVLENTKNNEFAVLETKCIYTKETIATAFKVFVSHYTIFRYISAEMNQNFYTMLNRLHILVDKNKYDQYIKLHKKIHSKGIFSKKPTAVEMQEYTSYFQNASMCNEHDEVNKIQMKVQQYWGEYLKADKPLTLHEPYEYIYNLIGLEYKDEYGQAFYEEGMRVIEESKS